MSRAPGGDSAGDFLLRDPHAQENGLAELSVPRDIFYVIKLPVLATGKTDYLAIKSLMESQG